MHVRFTPMQRGATALAVIALLAGCSSRPIRSERSADKPATTLSGSDYHGTTPVIKEDYEDVNLLWLLDPEAKARAKYDTRSAPGNGTKRGWTELEISEKYDLAFDAFENEYGSSRPQKRSIRNLVQERIMSASERRCHTFKVRLRQLNADSNFGFGIATTVSAGLGALIPGLHASKNLAGLAGILSGVRGEFNDAYFSNVTVTVLIRGIDESRQEAQDKLRVAAQQSIDDYSIGAAIKDAMAYDSRCTAVAGLEKAGDALVKLSDPGLESMNRALLKAKVTNRIANNQFMELKDDLDALQKAGVDTRWLVPRGRVYSGQEAIDGTGFEAANFLDDGASVTLFQAARREVSAVDAASQATQLAVAANLKTTITDAAQQKVVSDALAKWVGAATPPDGVASAPAVVPPATVPSGIAKGFSAYVFQTCVQTFGSDKVSAFEKANLNYRAAREGGESLKKLDEKKALLDEASADLSNVVTRIAAQREFLVSVLSKWKDDMIGFNEKVRKDKSKDATWADFMAAYKVAFDKGLKLEWSIGDLADKRQCKN